MPSILMCPIYIENDEKSFKHLDEVIDILKIKKADSLSDMLFHKKELEIVKKDWHYRFHSLSVNLIKNGNNNSDINDENLVVKKFLDNAIIDFKHYFTVPASYLNKNRENRLFRLDDIYAEQITLKFATFLARVTMPD